MASASARSRTRIIVLQALFVSLLLTLTARLWYLQVDQGEAYIAKASSQSVRNVTVQPERGLIVDDMGRPLVSNRQTWVVSIDKNTLAKLDEAERPVLLKRVAKATGVSVKKIEKTINEWNGSRYEPVPVDTDVPEDVALSILEQPEDYPAVVAEQSTVRHYPSPYGVNAAHLLGYLSPITDKEYAAAREDGDVSRNATSSVGRAGVEKQYDEWLRGIPGSTTVPVDSMGRPTGEGTTTESQPGDTLVTSIDAKVQSVVEEQLHTTIKNARTTFDKVSGRNYEADSGAVVVLEAKTGRVVSMASQPTYDPGVWVGGISSKELTAITSEKSGNPLLGRALQGQFAPGSTWKPFMTAAALSNGYAADTKLNCSPSLQIGNRAYHNHESASYGYIDFARALEVSCNTVFMRVGLGLWNKYGSDPADAEAKDPLGKTARNFGFGAVTGIDIPGESRGRVGDRVWRAAYYEQTKDYYCEMDKKGTAESAFLKKFAYEFCLQGNYFRQGDAANFSIGQGDTMVTPLQLATAYAALSNGGTLWQPTVGKAVVSADGKVIKEIAPVATRKVKVTKKSIDYVNQSLLGTVSNGTLAWKFNNFPLDQVKVAGKTGSAEVEGKQSTSWVATYDKNYVVIMMVTQGGTGSGTSGDPVREIWKALYGVNDAGELNKKNSAIPGVTQSKDLPTFTDDGAILPPARTGTMGEGQ